jgi:hypothetical protein
MSINLIDMSSPGALITIVSKYILSHWSFASIQNDGGRDRVCI